MVAAVIMLVILCQRKQRKNKQTQVAEKPDVTVTAEELYKENDRNSNISDLKLELRQANGSCEIVSTDFVLGELVNVDYDKFEAKPIFLKRNITMVIILIECN